jgi:hypothetical protein
LCWSVGDCVKVLSPVTIKGNKIYYSKICYVEFALARANLLHIFRVIEGCIL